MGLTSIYGPSSPLGTPGLATDVQSLGNLKAEAGKGGADAIKETAKQFESLFMRELLKSMREAGPKSGMLDNAGSDLGTDMLDQQFAVQMSGQPGGLSDLIAQQLTRQMGGAAATETSKATATLPPVTIKGNATSASTRTHRPPTDSQVNFVQKHSDIASKIERASGIPAGYMLGQAGHETGWGKFEIKHKGGAPSFNLFGIKAGSNWTGKVAEVTTTEYVNGVAQKRVAKFRAYDSYEDSFKDYAKLINESPRYAQARAQTGSVKAFTAGLQKAGYATDPEYANKLSRAINTTLQLRRVQV
jgi:flagellar protein FlgJ